MSGFSMHPIRKDLAATQIYTKVQQEHLRKVIGELSSLLPVSQKNTTQSQDGQQAERKLLKSDDLQKAAEKLAERGGFEPPVKVSPYDGLANRWFQPLTHLSGLNHGCGIRDRSRWK
jgi:hypothetical protein